MAATATWTEGDTAGDVSFTFTENGAAVDLTGKTVRMRFTRVSDQASLYADLVLTDPTNGVGVVPLALVPATQGTYAVEAVETFSDTTHAVLPTAAPLTVLVRAPGTVPEP